MKAMLKIALVGTSVLSIGALTACQSTNNVQSPDQAHMMKHHADKQHHKDHRLTPEQREKFAAARQQRAELNKQIRQACDNKAVGSSVEIKSGDKTLAGTCAIHFKADPKALKAKHDEARAKGEHRPMAKEGRTFTAVNRGEPLTDAQRAELTKKYDERLAKRQAQQKAMLQACQGKTDGAVAQLKVGEQSIDGKCHVRFQPKPAVVATSTASK
ncbi:hypothetical protein GFH30_02510 [Acinetobacter wanghuae]|uniref:Uncharacterized protein n=1 Tax=Acinetobacter wanghuae TaxID=2662362 RepID=A0A5Q0P1M6_9GAMM|nr:hypothetical protein [Acinetobacter wanghuae]MQW90827.1 hypothetical protein [Acinetobacter wanghuae]QGA10340.1 hypothetical protein GFH30_02510 [Acinetobacter wanghuae]